MSTTTRSPGARGPMGRAWYRYPRSRCDPLYTVVEWWCPTPCGQRFNVHVVFNEHGSPIGLWPTYEDAEDYLVRLLNAPFQV